LKKAVVSVLVSLVLAILTLAAFEGAYSLVKWNKPHRSVIYQLSALAGLTRVRSEIGAYKPYFSNPQELAALAPLLKESAIGLGNTPFDVRSADSAIRIGDNDCPSLKPNLHVTTFILHSSAFGPLGFPTVFYDLSKRLDPRIEDFFQKYGGPRTTLSTNAEGERITVPDVAADKVVLVAGDWVAFGALVDDDATIASQMQARDSARRYVNLGVPGTTAGQIHCRLEAATQRYKGKIDELVYVYCENDFDDKIPYGTPKEVVESLARIVKRENIGKVTVVFSPLVYMVVPELTRIEGSEWSPSLRREPERAELKSLVETAGFRWLDIGELARSEEDEKKSSLAIWAYYVDFAHLSSYGTRKVVDSLTGSD
jgi:hypothetical protein